jgi:biopolymer transport protein ExbD
MNLNGFGAPSDDYELEMLFPKGTECLKERHPRVVIRTHDLEALEEVGDLLSSIFHYFAIVGLAFVPWALAIWIRRRFTREGPRMFPGTKPGNHLRVLHQRPMRMFAELPNFGLMFGAVLWIVAFIFMVNLPPPSRGLLIGLRADDAIGLAVSPWPETISVYLGIGEKYYVNGQQVAQRDLRARLEEKLGRSAVWTVYFEADGNTLNGNAIYAMDTIRELGAKLVWITPKVRENLRQRQVGTHPTTR